MALVNDGKNTTKNVCLANFSSSSLFVPAFSIYFAFNEVAMEEVRYTLHRVCVLGMVRSLFVERKTYDVESLE